MYNNYRNHSVYSDWYRAVVVDSNIRMMNAVTNVPAIDVYSNDNLIAGNLGYGKVSQYLPVSAGEYRIKVFPVGVKTNPFVDTVINIPLDTITIIAVIGTRENASIYPIPEPVKANNFNKACIRFVQLSSDAPVVDLSLPDGMTVFANVLYKDYTVYACFPAGSYTFEVRAAGTNNIILSIPNTILEDNIFYSIFLLGLTSGHPKLEAVIITEPR